MPVPSLRIKPAGSLPARRDEPAPSGLRTFVTAWRRDPAGIGALVPSSPALARAVARQVASIDHGTIVELGPGSGAITAALLGAKISPRRLYLVERNPALAAFLRRRFEGVRIVEGDARRLPWLVRRDGIGKVSAIISSIPLRNLDFRTRYTILKRSFDLLGPSGMFVQYTYSHLSPLPRELESRLGLTAERTGYVWLNMPPASVWTFRPAAAVEEATEPPVRAHRIAGA